MPDLTQRQSKNLAKLGAITEADSRIRFIMDVIVPGQKWNIIDEGSIKGVAYPPSEMGPLVTTDELKSRLAFFFGVVPEGKASDVMTRLVFPNMENSKTIFFF